MKVTVDVETCTGCGLCIDACPDVFEMSEKNLAVVKVPVVPPAAEGPCRDAAEGCPVEAIKIEE